MTSAFVTLCEETGIKVIAHTWHACILNIKRHMSHHDDSVYFTFFINVQVVVFLCTLKTK